MPTNYYRALTPPTQPLPSDINNPNTKNPKEWERLPNETLDQYNQRLKQYNLRVKQRPDIWEDTRGYTGDLTQPLKNAQLMNPGDLAFLKDKVNLGQSFGSGSAGRFQNYYQPGQGTSEQLFMDLIKNIGAPSSVDEVQKGLETQGLQELLRSIDDSTRQSAGSLKADFLERGLGGPAQMSNIESSGLGQVYGEGNKAKTTAALEYKLRELERQRDKETALRSAYGTRYGAGVSSDTQGRDISSRGALADQAMYADLLKSSTSLNQQGGLEWAKLMAELARSGAGYQNERDMLLAQLLNSRDLAQADINAGRYAQPEQKKDKGSFSIGVGPVSITKPF